MRFPCSNEHKIQLNREIHQQRNGNEERYNFRKFIMFLSLQSRVSFHLNFYLKNKLLQRLLHLAFCASRRRRTRKIRASLQKVLATFLTTSLCFHNFQISFIKCLQWFKYYLEDGNFLLAVIATWLDSQQEKLRD